MASTAWSDWEGAGQTALNELLQIHVKATGSKPGRRWTTTQLNRSLLVALVAQFQGYCRDLHNEAVAVHVGAASAGQGPLLQVLLTQGRKLDSGNPRKSALGADFGKLGFAFIPAVAAATVDGQAQMDALEELVDYRNAIVHNNEPEITSREARTDLRSTKTCFRNRRMVLRKLATTMDAVVARQLATLLSIQAPW